ncbi:hypothetical protein FUSO6_03275 [Fusobacterium necrophorum DAB]|uniref:Uncharacterized protein n=1 Tax=Fusobacterium necrophorum BL TaxID=1441732 RepID=A0AB73BU92_9FUSO|nr:hypothetical protein [Fusobacterium necrophorum]KDE61687.1 hypothetical protein FUSO3_09740 [Fusobacterium necrophorum BL]KDE70744.1 hypothetical protein FUSO6_03275 [Fusobacterium necrophorum DAB]
MNQLMKEAIQSIEKNIDKGGLYRYDLRDTRWLPLFSKETFSSKILRKSILFLEEFFPIIIRKILKIHKKIWPTTYTFLGTAYYLNEKYKLSVDTNHTSLEYVNLCIKKYIKDIKDLTTWWNDEENVSEGKLIIESTNHFPTILMHALARLNIMLLNVGNLYGNSKYLDIASRSVEQVLQNHYFIEFENGIKSVSYYYNTYDSTININSEFCHWLSLLPKEKHTEKSIDLMKSILKLVLSEQNEDGSWFYYSKWHMKKYGNKPSCDCHHTGTVLYNLINIIKCPFLNEKFREETIKSINKGMKYYIKNFFNLSTGKAKTLIGYKRTAGPVQYSEAIFAFSEYLLFHGKLDNELFSIIKCLLPKVVKNNLELIDLKNGKVPSEKVFKWLHLDSIRWGNGPVFQSIMYYLAVKRQLGDEIE